MSWIIKDWADNKPFGEKLFDSFEDADAFLDEYFFKTKKDPEEWRQEYEIEEVQS